MAKQYGITEEVWEHKSFKDRGLEIKPTIHLGEKASALERKGIKTDKGNHNREVRRLNTLIVKVQEIKAQSIDKAVSATQKTAASVVKAVKNEILDVIQAVAKRYNNRLKFPVIKSGYIRLIPNRGTLQDKEGMSAFVKNMGWTTFDEMMKFYDTEVEKNDRLKKDRDTIFERKAYLEDLLYEYGIYEPYIENHKEQWALKGFARKKYEREHIAELEYYDYYRQLIKDKIKEPDKKITPKAWKKELSKLEERYSTVNTEYAKSVYRLAGIETLNYNRKELDRMLETEHTEKTVEHKKDRNVSL